MIRVAIVEDLSTIREGLKLILSNTEGFNCAAAYSNAEDALLDLPAVYPDITIMDINLPGMSGIDCIKNLKEKCPNTQFMIFSIYDDEDYIFDALKAGASGYLLKKTSPGKIIDALTELQNGGSPMSSQIARKVIASFKTPASQKTKDAALSDREMEVISLLAKGLLYKEIADKLSITMGTVKRHIHNIYDKLYVTNKTEAINKVFNSNQKLFN